MDLKVFSQDNFNSKQWINDFLNDISQEMSDKDSLQAVSSTVLKMQAAFHETDAEIKTIAEELPLVIPRTLQDLDLLSKDLMLLKDQMNTVGHDIRAAEKQSTEAMKTLFTLETMKQRMAQTEKALKETDNWISLTSDVEDLCIDGDSEKLSDRLVKLHKCFTLLAPGLSAEAVTERRTVLSSLADRYEAIISPALVKAFNDLDRDTVSKFVEVFMLIGRMEQLQSYYWRSRVSKYCAHWEKLLERHSTTQFSYALSEFYVDLTRSWQQEVQWCSLLFDKPAILSCRVLVELSEKLEPKFSEMLTSRLNSQEHQKVKTLLEFKSACDDFTESVTTSGYLPAHSDLPKKLFELVYKPLIQSFEGFQNMFETEFRSVLDTIILDHVEIGECVQLLARSEEKVFDQGHSIKENCEKLLDGFIAPVFIPSYETFLTEYFGEFKRVSVNLRERVFTKVMAGEGLSPDHWSIVNNCIQLTVVVGKCSEELSTWSEQLCSEVSSTGGVFSDHFKSSNESLLPIFIDCLSLESPKFRQLYRSFVNAVKSDEKVKAVLPRSFTGISKLASVVCKFTLDVLTKPAYTHLNALVSSQPEQHSNIHSSVSSESMPDYSFAPKHEIAELGQYLLTLPHHLDTFGNGNERHLIEAMQLSAHPCIELEKDYKPRSSVTSENDYPQQTSELLLEPVGNLLTEKIISLLKKGNFKCENITMAKQLATDIEYLLGVFDDLGQMPPSSSTLKQLVSILRAGSAAEVDESTNADAVDLGKKLLS